MKVYRSRNGIVLGVCSGLEEATGIPAKYFRILLILTAVIFRGWIVLTAYLIAAVLLPLRRPEGYEGRGFRENFEDLREDIRMKAGEEYREFMHHMSRSSTSDRDNGSEPENPEDSERAGSSG